MANIKQLKIGNDVYDIKATYDGDNNNIASTYVKKTGDTMSGNLWISDGLTKGTNPTADTTRYLSFVDGQGTAGANRTGALINQIKTNGTSFTGVYAYDFTNGSESAQILRLYKPLGGNGYSNVSGANVADAVIRNIQYGTAAPSGGSNGDLYVQYNTTSVHPFLDVVYPVGAIYLSTVNTNPGTLFGGTWEQIKDRFLLAAGDTYSAGGTGGSATMSHTHTAKHSHTEGNLAAAVGAVSNDIFTIAYQAGSKNSRGPSSVTNYSIWGEDVSQSSRSFNHHTRVYGTTAESTPTTSDASNTNNMPPYLTVYVWKRTA